MKANQFMQQAHTQSIITRLTKAGAPKPLGSSPLWNEWAANNSQPEAIALAKLDAVKPMTQSMKAIAHGAQPVNNFY